MLRFDDLQLFVRAADLGSLSAAARVMDMSPAVASAALKRIEAQLNTRLLARSTRSLRLTAEGEGFLEYARTALSSLDEGRRLLARGQDQVSGVLQLSAPRTSGVIYCCPGWISFSVSTRSSRCVCCWGTELPTCSVSR